MRIHNIYFVSNEKKKLIPLSSRAACVQTEDKCEENVWVARMLSNIMFLSWTTSKVSSLVKTKSENLCVSYLP